MILRRLLFLVVGVRGTPFPLADSICSVGLAIPVSASESLSSSTKPMPGVSGFCDTAGRVEGSSLKRQERAKTPARRMRVPNAILQVLVSQGVDLRGWASLTRRA